jgi:NADPH2:quinone reductase
MRAIAIRPAAPGGPEVLAPTDVELPPAPAAGHARVRVRFAGVNFIDVYQRSGAYPLPRPLPLGQEGAGEIEALGADVDPALGLAVGTRVAWSNVLGSYASHLDAPAERLVAVPAGLTLDQAAAAMLQGMTAHYLTRSTFPLAAGQRCLIHAAAGGVGQLACQLARAAGATVLGTVSTDAKAELARAAGCDDPIRYDRDDLVAEVRRITTGSGVDVVYDSVGKDTFARSLDCLRPRGMLVLFGQSSGAVPPVDLQVLAQKGSLFLTRPTLGHYVATRAELVARAGDVLGAVERGALRLRVDRTIPLAEASTAHRLLESRATTGKLLLAIP